MVSIQESLKALKAKGDVREAEINKAKKRLRARTKGTITSQFKIASGVGAGRVGAELDRRKKQSITQGQQLSQASVELAGFRSSISRASANRLSPSEQEERQKIIDENQARFLFNKAVSRRATPLTGENEAVKRRFKELLNARESKLPKLDLARREKLLELNRQGLTPITDEQGNIVGFESEKLKQSFEVGEITSKDPGGFKALQDVGIFEKQSFGSRKGEPLFTTPSGIEVGGDRLPTLQEFKRETNIVSAVDRPSGSGGALFDIRQEQSSFSRDNSLRGKVNKTAGGFVTTLLGAELFAESFITKPIQTIKDIPGGIVSGFEFVRSGGLTRKIINEPESVVGSLIGEALLFKGTGKALELGGKGIEIGRTITSPKFKPVLTRELTQFGTTERFIGGVGGDVGEIVLIPAGLQRKASTLRPSVRGGFGFSKFEQAQFIGQKGSIVTSQRGFNSFDIPLEKTLFATPPLQETGFARASRLGLEAQPKATFLDILSGDFTFKKSQPQIIVFPNEVVGRPGGFQPFGLPSTELEVTLEGKTITKTGQPGVTLIGEKRVPIITAKIVEGERRTIKGFEGFSFKDLTRKGKGRSGFDLSSTLRTTPLRTTPLVSPTRLVGSSAITSIRILSSGFSSSSSAKSLRSLTKSGQISGTLKGGSGSFFGGFSGSSGGVSPPPRTGGGFTGFSGGFGGLPTFRGFNAFEPIRRTAERRKKKKKKIIKRRINQFNIAPSFTAQVLNIRGNFPKPLVKGLGLTPGQLRVLPRRKRRT